MNRALRAFWKAPDKAAAQAALAQVAASIQGLSHSTSIAFQKQLPSETEEAGKPEPAAAAQDQTAESEEVEDTAEGEQAPQAAAEPSEDDLAAEAE